MAKDKYEDYDSMAANNADVGGVAIQGSSSVALGDNALRELMSHTADHFAADTIASAATTDLGSKAAHHLTVSGTTTITSLGTVKAGTKKSLRFSGALTLTHNGTSLILPGGANIVTAVGDAAEVVSEGSGNWRTLHFQPAAPVPNTLNGQYKFPVTQNASSDANTLDDYEEGTWTPALITDSTAFSAVTYDGVTTGKYIKIGKLVFVTGRLLTDSVSVGSASGNVGIGGLPFTADATQPAGSLAIGAVSNWNAQNPMQMRVQQNTTTAFLTYRSSVTGGAISVTPSGVNTGADQNNLEFGGCYYAAA